MTEQERFVAHLEFAQYLRKEGMSGAYTLPWHRMLGRAMDELTDARKALDPTTPTRNTHPAT